jgi:hypothetical protein
MAKHDLLIIFRVSYFIGSKQDDGDQHKYSSHVGQIDCNQYWMLIPPADNSRRDIDRIDGSSSSSSSGVDVDDDSFMVLMKLVDRDDLFMVNDYGDDNHDDEDKSTMKMNNSSDKTCNANANNNNNINIINNITCHKMKELLSEDDMEVMQELAEFFDQSLQTRVHGDTAGTHSYDPMSCPSNTINALVR